MFITFNDCVNLEYHIRLKMSTIFSVHLLFIQKCSYIVFWLFMKTYLWAVYLLIHILYPYSYFSTLTETYNIIYIPRIVDTIRRKHRLFLVFRCYSKTVCSDLHWTLSHFCWNSTLSWRKGSDSNSKMSQPFFIIRSRIAEGLINVFIFRANNRISSGCPRIHDGICFSRWDWSVLSSCILFWQAWKKVRR